MTPSDTAAAPAQRHAYAIVLRHVLVAEDLRETLLEFDPAARIETFHSFEEALPFLDSEPDLRLALLADEHDHSRWRSETDALRARGVALILITREESPRTTPPGWQMLERPFSTAVVMKLLRGAIAG